ncbi:MAG: hypothetical protein GY822_25980 [Deltaproteobacteria bacterium]|nr:hypothetical protein [Deltaproteobacteria bacterium]
MNKERERLIALGGAIILLAAGVWISQKKGVDDVNSGAKSSKNGSVVFPRTERAKEKMRQRRQAALSPLNQVRAKSVEQGNQALSRALSIPNKANVFVDVQALAKSPLLKKLLACQPQEISALEEIESVLGIDPLKDVHRVGVMDGVTAATGAFRDLKLPEEIGEGKPYGESAFIYPPKEGEQHLAKVGDGLVLLGESKEQLQAAIDRVEKGGEVPSSTWSAGMNEADVVGNLDSKLLTALLKGMGKGFPEKAEELLKDGVVRLNVEDDITASFDFAATSAQNGTDLSKSIKGAIAALRMKAAADDEGHLADLLSQTRIEDFEDGTFAVDLAVPGPFLLKLLECNEAPQ